MPVIGKGSRDQWSGDPLKPNSAVVVTISLSIEVSGVLPISTYLSLFLAFLSI